MEEETEREGASKRVRDRERESRQVEKADSLLSEIARSDERV
jgi:hypothetical protein